MSCDVCNRSCAVRTDLISQMKTQLTFRASTSEWSVSNNNDDDDNGDNGDYNNNNNNNQKSSESTNLHRYDSYPDHDPQPDTEHDRNLIDFSLSDHDHQNQFRQANRQTERQTDRQTNRQTDSHENITFFFASAKVIIIIRRRRITIGLIIINIISRRICWPQHNGLWQP